MITDEQVEEAGHFLAHCHEEVQRLVFLARKAEHMLTQREAMSAKQAKETAKMGADQAKWEARASAKWEEAALFDAKATAELAALRARIKGAETLIEIWRTQQASSRGLR